ncbi:4-hydroxybutyrate coenzyme A transferase [Toxocara canis]|uniref:4-hydroxybutyrate coenzyme A transferase n=1 Tax=Toxocara canis TaxID=6265 RepID=A0A0B2V992_TOXCA|nr:4-hydroxybutyrate coenzyme A transferase [Toxocara canis]
MLLKSICVLPIFCCEFASFHAKPKTLRTLTRCLYDKKPHFMTLADAASLIESGSSIYVHPAAPIEILNEVCRRVGEGRLKDLHLNHMLILGDAPWNKPQFYGKIRSNCLFICDGTRKLVQEGEADYTPIFLSQAEELYESFAIPVDVALITVSPIDEHGYCSLGISADSSVAAARAATKIIAVVDDMMPRTFGDTVIHASQIDALVRAKHRVHAKEEGCMEADEISMKIGSLIADNLVDDGATLQIGIGKIPDSTLRAMKGHKDLGVHTEALADGVMHLMRRNVITNARKSTDVGKVVTTYAHGTRRLYEFIDNNPAFLFRSCGYTNDPAVIRKQHKMTAINSAIEVDLTGQVVADSVGKSFYSGFGGQVDFIYGASIAEDGRGKPVIALSSTTPTGSSKIVPFLKQGAGVVTTRAHVRYVVTEYGIASLWGKSVRERAYELIRIAHPDHREKLEKAAFERLQCMPCRDAAYRMEMDKGTTRAED